MEYGGRERRRTKKDLKRKRLVRVYKRGGKFRGAEVKEGEKKKSEALFAEGSVLCSDLHGKYCLQMTRFYQNAHLIGLLWALKTYCLRKELDRD